MARGVLEDLAAAKAEVKETQKTKRAAEAVLTAVETVLTAKEHSSGTKFECLSDTKRRWSNNTFSKTLAAAQNALEEAAGTYEIQYGRRSGGMSQAIWAVVGAAHASHGEHMANTSIPCCDQLYGIATCCEEKSRLASRLNASISDETVQKCQQRALVDVHDALEKAAKDAQAHDTLAQSRTHVALTEAQSAAANAFCATLKEVVQESTDAEVKAIAKHEESERREAEEKARADAEHLAENCRRYISYLKNYEENKADWESRHAYPRVYRGDDYMTDAHDMSTG